MHFKHLVGTLALSCSVGVAQAQTLTIYTYESFTSEWGPGPVLAEKFAARCDCEVNFVGLEDGVALLNRLRLEGDQSQADIILGLDDGLMAEAKALGLMVDHGQDLSLNIKRIINTLLLIHFFLDIFYFDNFTTIYKTRLCRGNICILTFNLFHMSSIFIMSR